MGGHVMKTHHEDLSPLGGTNPDWRIQENNHLGNVRVLVVVEGIHDIDFLRRLGAVLHGDDPSLPDLAGLEEKRELIFVPYGGGDPAGWTHRLAGLQLAEFHLYDRELPPETEVRRSAAALVNRRPGCQAAVTTKRSLENYLHTAAIRDIRGIDLTFGDDDDVAELAARACYLLRRETVPWRLLPARARKRLKDRAKHWLNTYAAEQMTVTRLAERDPAGEVRSWLAAIGRLAGTVC